MYVIEVFSRGIFTKLGVKPNFFFQWPVRGVKLGLLLEHSYWNFISSAFLEYLSFLLPRGLCFD